MSRRVLYLVALFVVVVVAGAVALGATARPRLVDRRDTVDARWSTLRGPLAARYEGLAQLRAALANAGAGERTYGVALSEGLAEWERLTTRPDLDAAAEAAAANRLEGLAARVRANVAGSARLGADAAITEALASFDATLVSPPDVRAYNRAVRRYQDARTAGSRRLVAGVLGFEARPVLVLGTPARD